MEHTAVKVKTPPSLLTEAYEALLEKLGPDKTARVWQTLIPPQGDYLDIRKQLFANKDAATLDREIAEFNRQ